MAFSKSVMSGWLCGAFSLASILLSQYKHARLFSKTFDRLHLWKGVLSFSRKYFRATFLCNIFATQLGLAL